MLKTFYALFLISLLIPIASAIDLTKQIRQAYSPNCQYSIIKSRDYNSQLPAFDMSRYFEKLKATESLHRKENFSTGALITADAIALTLGMGIFADDESDWLNSKNSAFLAADILTGTSLIYLSFQDDKLHRSKWYWILTVVSIASHLTRQYEYSLNKNDAYCSNSGMYAINSVKLTASIASGTTGLILKIKLGKSESI